jgi:hypothetical protein
MGLATIRCGHAHERPDYMRESHVRNIHPGTLGQKRNFGSGLGDSPHMPEKDQLRYVLDFSDRVLKREMALLT